MATLLPIKKIVGKTRKRKIAEFNEMLVRLMAYCIRTGIPFRGGEWHRPKFVCEEYVRRGTGILNSKHRYSLGIDLWVSPKGWDLVYWPKSQRNIPNQYQAMYRRMGEYWTKMGGIWGGNFKNRWDCYHYEHPEAK